MRDSGLCGGFEQAFCPLDIYLAGLAEGARGAVDYGIDALYGRLQSHSREEIPSYGARSATPAINESPDTLGGETLYHAPAEHPHPSRDEDLQRVHREPSSLSACSSGSTFSSFSGLTTSRIAVMLPSDTSTRSTTVRPRLHETTSEIDFCALRSPSHSTNKTKRSFLL